MVRLFFSLSIIVLVINRQVDRWNSIPDGEVVDCLQIHTYISQVHHIMSHVLRKSVFVICEQQRRRSACADRCLDSIITLVSICENSSLYLASMASQASLSLPWSQTSKTGFPTTRLQCMVFRSEGNLILEMLSLARTS